jgi:hypothetical protein
LPSPMALPAAARMKPSLDAQFPRFAEPMAP